MANEMVAVGTGGEGEGKARGEVGGIDEGDGGVEVVWVGRGWA
jgi:hypothetical protein